MAKIGTRHGRYYDDNYGYEDQLYRRGTGSTIYHNPREQEEEATHAGPYAGRGPQNYFRPDARISEEIHERLTDHPTLDATDIVVVVNSGNVTLKGQVNRRAEKHLAEDLAAMVSGVRDVENQLRVEKSPERARNV